MADNDMSFRQRAVIEFLVKEEIPAAEIHQRLQRAYINFDTSGLYQELLDEIYDLVRLLLI